MQVEWDRDRCFDSANEVIGVERRQEPGHVFNTERVGSQVLKLFSQIHETVYTVDGADGIADGGFDMFAAGLYLSHSPFDIADIVQCIEDTKDVNAIRRGPLDESFQHIVGIVPISDQVLTAEQHLELGIGHGGP